MSYLPPPPPEYPGGYASGPPAQYNPYGGYPPPRGSNGLALASMIVSLVSIAVCPLAGAAGAIMGHVARGQIKETGEEGEGFALTGIIVGWIISGLSLLLIVGYILLAVFLFSATATRTDSGGYWINLLVG
ncbi:MAG: DUF4190 domain-containing protein [Micromonosporaceae bacterium]